MNLSLLIALRRSENTKPLCMLPVLRLTAVTVSVLLSFSKGRLYSLTGKDLYVLNLCTFSKVEHLAGVKVHDFIVTGFRAYGPPYDYITLRFGKNFLSHSL